jgi:N4-gp56 family major capsid protein
MAVTKKSNLIIPEVLGQYLDVKMMDKIKLTPVAKVFRDLQGVAGDTISIPVWAFCGLGEIVPEGEDVALTNLSASKKDVKVAKAGKGIAVTKESMISAYGDVQAEVSRQLLMAIAGKVEEDMFTALRGATLKHSGAIDKQGIATALIKFGEDIEEKMYLYISPSAYAELRSSQDFVEIANGKAIINGHVGQFMGCEVIVSGRVQESEAFIVKEEALGLVLKEAVDVEMDKNIVNQTYVYTAFEHYACALINESRAIAITIA